MLDSKAGDWKGMGRSRVSLVFEERRREGKVGEEGEEGFTIGRSDSNVLKQERMDGKGKVRWN